LLSIFDCFLIFLKNIFVFRQLDKNSHPAHFLKWQRLGHRSHCGCVCLFQISLLLLQISPYEINKLQHCDKIKSTLNQILSHSLLAVFFRLLPDISPKHFCILTIAKSSHPADLLKWQRLENRSHCGCHWLFQISLLLPQISPYEINKLQHCDEIKSTLNQILSHSLFAVFFRLLPDISPMHLCILTIAKSSHPADLLKWQRTGH